MGTNLVGGERLPCQTFRRLKIKYIQCIVPSGRREFSFLSFGMSRHRKVLSKNCLYTWKIKCICWTYTFKKSDVLKCVPSGDFLQTTLCLRYQSEHLIQDRQGLPASKYDMVRRHHLCSVPVKNSCSESNPEDTLANTKWGTY